MDGKKHFRLKMIMGNRFAYPPCHAIPTIACDPSLERAKEAPDNLADVDPTFVVWHGMVWWHNGISLFLGAWPCIISFYFMNNVPTDIVHRALYSKQPP